MKSTKTLAPTGHYGIFVMAREGSASCFSKRRERHGSLDGIHVEKGLKIPPKMVGEEVTPGGGRHYISHWGGREKRGAVHPRTLLEKRRKKFVG